MESLDKLLSNKKFIKELKEAIINGERYEEQTDYDQSVEGILEVFLHNFGNKKTPSKKIVKVNKLDGNREKINSRIKQLGIKKNKVAEKLGISTVWLSYYLQGKKDLGVDTENKLLKMLGF